MIPAELSARHIVGRSYEDLPAAMVDTTKRPILDAFGTIIGGPPRAWCRILVVRTIEWGGRAQSTVVVDAELAPLNAPAPLRLKITRRSGERIVRRIDVLKGAPGRAVTWNDTVEKFWTCWRYASPAVPESQGQQAVERPASREHEADISAIVRLLRPSS
jgi:2-methylcitrate dehydratase PrpD